jgi:regulation of enolase protein 1 (concanavalin A-like superfamily)
MWLRLEYLPSKHEGPESKLHYYHKKERKEERQTDRQRDFERYDHYGHWKIYYSFLNSEVHIDFLKTKSQAALAFYKSLRDQSSLFFLKLRTSCSWEGVCLLKVPI